MDRPLTTVGHPNVAWFGSVLAGGPFLKFTSGGISLLRGAHPRSTGSHQLGEHTGVHGDLELLLAVDLNHRDADPVLELEVVVAADVDLVEVERCAGAFGKDRVARDVAEVTPVSGIQDDPHERDGTGRLHRRASSLW
jgi:hypothetical protein